MKLLLNIHENKYHSAIRPKAMSRLATFSLLISLGDGEHCVATILQLNKF